MGQENHLGIYIHIPFCVRKCLYCDFLSAPVGEADREAYCEMLCKEIAEKGKESAKYRVDTIFLGGGTPSLLLGKQARKIMDAVFLNFRVEKDAEISTAVQESYRKYLNLKADRTLSGINPEQFIPGLDIPMMYRDMYWASEGYLWEMAQRGNVDVDDMEQGFTKLMDFWKSVYLKKE